MTDITLADDEKFYLITKLQWNKTYTEIPRTEKTIEDKRLWAYKNNFTAIGLLEYNRQWYAYN